MIDWIRNLFSELKRRRVFRVAGVYAAVAFVVLQAAGILFPALLLPEWALRMVVAFAIVAFPIALVLAWAFEITPEGVNRTSAPVTGGTQTGGKASRIAIVGAVAVLAVAGAGWWYSASRLDRRAAAAAAELSIAVLPFDNLSASEENAYFAAGVHEDILTQLALIEDLAVISRTSVLPYQETGKSIPEIARELGVAYILEGSVRRAGDRVRITAQLIDAATDEHVWAETYDRTLADIFAVQSEVATTIASAMDATLTPDEQRRIGARPTENMAAYELYLRARELPPLDAEKNEQAIVLFKEAIRLDPTFAGAYGALSSRYMQRVQTHGYPAAWADSGVALAREAIRLDPELARAYVNLGANLEYLGRVREGTEAYRRALELNPNDVTAMIDLSFSLQRRGQFAEALRWARRAVPLDPHNPYPPNHVAVNNWLIGFDSAAQRWLERSLAIDPGFLFAHWMWIYLDLSRGRPEAARERAHRLLEEHPGNFTVLVMAADAALYGRAPEDARRFFERLVRRAPDGANIATGRSYRTALAYTLLETGQPERARALLGASLERAHELLERGDETPHVRVEIAAIHALRGDDEEAYVWLEHAYEAGLRVHRMTELDPVFDELRGEPRFQRLLDRIEVDLAAMRRRVEARERSSA